jgi:hypothetical protein
MEFRVVWIYDLKIIILKRKSTHTIFKPLSNCQFAPKQYQCAPQGQKNNS